MKIALVTQAFPPMVSGAAVIVQHVANTLADNGHQILVLAASDQVSPYNSYGKNLTIMRLRSHFNPMRANQRMVLWQRSAVLEALRLFKPDVIHVHEYFLLALISLAYRKRFKSPCVLTIHALPPMATIYLPDIFGMRGMFDLGLWSYGEWLMKQFDGLLAPTRSVARTIAEKTGCMPAVISGGVDLNVFKPGSLPVEKEGRIRSELGIPSLVPVILNVGRLEPEKKVGFVIDAFSKTLCLQQSHLVIVGDGIERPDLQLLARRLRVEDRVHFAGFINDRQLLSDMYRLAAMFVTACETETQGLVLLEAAACGLPLVAVKTPVVSEIISDGVNGYMAPTCDVNQIAERIAWLLQDPIRRKQMGSASHQASLDHDFGKCIRDYEEYYASVEYKNPA